MRRALTTTRTYYISISDGSASKGVPILLLAEASDVSQRGTVGRRAVDMHRSSVTMSSASVSERKFAEKLTILNERGQGILTRVYNIKKVGQGSVCAWPNEP